MYRLEYDKTNALKKDKLRLIKKRKISSKIKSFLEYLVEDPFSKILNIKKLQPRSDNKFRLKIDNYRVIYSIDFGNKIIIIHRIGLRKDIYSRGLVG